MLRSGVKGLLSALPNRARVIAITFLLRRTLPGDPAAQGAGAAAA